MRSAARGKGPHAVSPVRRTGTHRRADVPDGAPLVLLVDDAEENRLVYATYLQQLDMRVEHAVDGEHALFKIMQFEPDLVVMDLSMPVLDGWEAIRQMRAHPRMRSIPVIALTGHASEESLELALTVGADVVLAKPCPPDELLETMRGLLRALRHD